MYSFSYFVMMKRPISSPRGGHFRLTIFVFRMRVSLVPTYHTDGYIPTYHTVMDTLLVMRDVSFVFEHSIRL